MAVDILKLSPNVAGVTFLAVGNAACDVIASIAAFSTGVPKVGVGTTLGAGIFVTTAVIGVVSFVSDVRLARRSFVRDILFFILTVVYLLVVSSDGFIDLGESIGFMIIYIVFVAVRSAARDCVILTAVMLLQMRESAVAFQPPSSIALLVNECLCSASPPLCVCR